MLKFNDLPIVTGAVGGMIKIHPMLKFNPRFYASSSPTLYPNPRIISTIFQFFPTATPISHVLLKCPVSPDKIRLFAFPPLCRLVNNSNNQIFSCAFIPFSKDFFSKNIIIHQLNNTDKILILVNYLIQICS